MTTERIDHALAARAALTRADFLDAFDQAGHLAAAQVHATLALVEETKGFREQQRIANLVSMWSEDSSGYVEAALVEKVDGKWKLRPDIAAALGLSDA